MLLANRFRGVSSSPHPYRRDDETTSRIEGVSRTFKGARTRIVSEVSGVRTQCFDYVIVGGGSAGCVLAARLSGDPTVKVALIEAGPPDDASEIHTPLAWPQLFKTQYDWDYAAEPEPWLDGRRVYLPRGRTLGGSSSINAMIYIRGNRVDFDDWAAAGAADWGYDAVLPYFIKAEANERCTDQYHGKFGPLSVSDSRSPHELYDAFVEAGLQAGWPYNADFNASQQDGVGRYQLTQRNWMRCSAAVALVTSVKLVEIRD
jgi:choline dehydrogenase